MQCRICGCDLDSAQAISCTRCRAPFHRDCWDFNGLCGIYGCGCRSFGAYAPSESGQVVAIDERTRPPFRLQPHFEALLRQLPSRGRRVFVPVGLGILASALVVALGGILYATVPHRILYLSAAGVGGLSGLLAALLGPLTRRRPGLLAAVFLAVATAGVSLWSLLPFAGLLTAYSYWTATLALAIVGSSAAAEVLTGSLRYHPRLSTLSKTAVRLVANFACFLLYIFLATLPMGRPLLEDVDIVLLVSLLSLSVAIPPLEVSKSALLHRLDQEAKMQARGSPPDTT